MLKGYERPIVGIVVMEVADIVRTSGGGAAPASLDFYENDNPSMGSF